MKIDWKKGRKCKKDRLIQVTTNEKECFSIYKLALLINQIAINELIIKKEKGFQKFLFKYAVLETLDMSEQGIDWAEKQNLPVIKKWCARNHLKFEKIEPHLQKLIQRRLDEYENSTN